MSETPNAVSDCPGREALAAYLVGRLSAEYLEKVAGHLSACPLCESSLEDIAARDTLVSRMRQCLRGSSAEVVASARVEALVRALARGPLAGATAARGPVSGEVPVTLAEFTPTRFGKYLLLEEIGRGGMGVVYRARDAALKREVALKKIRGGHADPRDRARFRTEAEAVARLEHPHVVRIFEFGEEAEVPYFAMELAEGGSLADRLAGGPLPERQAAELVARLARAAQAAHDRQIIHRDLKPGNVLLTADGAPKITDFGLAKLLDSDAQQTRSDAVFGTASYMAPEQARGESKEVGPRTDVYALGAILFESLTGRPPFRGKNWSETIEQVKTRPAEPPSRRRPGISAVLEAICLKCLEKEARRRYPSALRLAQDLESWLSGAPTWVRPGGFWSRAGRSARRHAVALTGAGLALSAVLLVFVVRHYLDPDRPVRRLEAELARGNRVVLVPEKGPPAWSRICLGEGTASTFLSRDGFFSVQAWDHGLVELVRDPRLEAFRLRAEIRHEDSKEPGAVGLFVFHSREPSRGVHYLVHLTYNDLYKRGELIARFPEKFRPKTIPNLNFVTLKPGVLREERTSALPSLDPGGGAAIPLFEAVGPVGGRWRTVELVIDRTAVRGVWEGNRPVLALPLPRLRDGARTFFDELDALSADAPPRGADRPLPPGGSVGLYVFQGLASFRNITIEPVVPGNP